jgi:transposase
MRLTARRAAVQVASDAQWQLHAMVITAPEAVRARFRGQSTRAMLACAAPIPTSSGKTVRYRLNRALHTVALSRLRYDPRIRDYADRRRTGGKTDREIRRCLKRYIARELYRRLESPSFTA